MTTSAGRWTLLNVAGFVAASLVSAALAKDELPKAVRSVLADESRLGKYDWNRRQRLGAELVTAKSSDEELYWQAGFVQVNGKWLPFEESITLQPIRSNEREYLERRARAEQSPKSQADLAKWCGQHGLLEQSQAHNYRAMMLSPPDVDVRDLYRRMRYVRGSTGWLSPYDANEAKSEARRYSEQLDQWTPVCLRLGEDLDRGRLSESTRRDRLSVLASEEKVPALEAVLGSRSEASALAAVEAIEQVSTYRATEAIGRMAVLSPWLFVRDRAIARLKSRKMEDYIPQWMSLARVPIRTEFQRLSSGWNLAFVFLLAEEGESEIRLVKNTVVAGRALTPAFLSDLGHPNALMIDRGPYLMRLNSTLKALDERMKIAADLSNEKIEVLNERVAVALKETVGKSAGDMPQEWWNWWTEQSGFEPRSQKKVIIVSEATETRPAPQGSCLVAGTPVWTERGLIAVEQVQVGDRALSKNIETGELAYKVVLHTTVRESFPVTKFVVGDETIHATEGHHFWVSGRGWTKMRELAAEQPLHTAIGALRVASTEPAESAPTYNLVVADFHTYFVGKSGILSHDVLPPKPTDKLVPGLGE